MTSTSRSVVLLLVLCLLAAGVIVLDTATADAHSPPCRGAYPWIRYRITVQSIVLGTFWTWYYNASTGATHRHGGCYGWQL